MGQFGAPFADAWTRSGSYAQGLIVFWAVMFSGSSRRSCGRCSCATGWRASGSSGSCSPCPPRAPRFRKIGSCCSRVSAHFRSSGRSFASVFETPPSPEAQSASRMTRTLAIVWLVLHAVVAPLLLPYRSLHMFRYDREIAAAGESAFAGAAPGQSVILINGENFYFTGMVPIVRPYGACRPRLAC